MIFCESALISLIVACSVANGPSMTVTESPTSKSTTLVSTAFVLRLLGCSGAGRASATTSSRVSGDGLVGVADEAGDAGGVADGAPGLVGQVHPDQHVAGELVRADHLALAVLDLDDLLLRDLDLEDVVLHVQRAGAALQVGLHPVLVAGVGVDDVPVAGGAAQRVAELLDGVDGSAVDLGVLGGSSSALGASASAASATAPRPRRPRPRRCSARRRSAASSAPSAASALGPSAASAASATSARRRGLGGVGWRRAGRRTRWRSLPGVRGGWNAVGASGGRR